MPAGALVVPVIVNAEVPAIPPESAMVEGLNEELIPLTLWMPSSSKLRVPVKSSGVAVKLKVAWPTAFRVTAVLSMFNQ